MVAARLVSSADSSWFIMLFLLLSCRPIGSRPKSPAGRRARTESPDGVEQVSFPGPNRNFHSALEAQNDLELLGRGHGQDPTSASPRKATRATIRRRSFAAPSLVNSPFGLSQGTRTDRRAASGRVRSATARTHTRHRKSIVSGTRG